MKLKNVLLAVVCAGLACAAALAQYTTNKPAVRPFPPGYGTSVRTNPPGGVSVYYWGIPSVNGAATNLTIYRPDGRVMLRVDDGLMQWGIDANDAAPPMRLVGLDEPGLGSLYLPGTGYLPHMAVGSSLQIGTNSAVTISNATVSASQVIATNGFYLFSPNGTRFRLSVDNAGAITTIQE